MRPFMYDHIEKIEALSDGRVRVVAVIPADISDDVIKLAEQIIHSARFLNTRSRVAHASRHKVCSINPELANVS